MVETTAKYKLQLINLDSVQLPIIIFPLSAFFHGFCFLSLSKGVGESGGDLHKNL